MKMVTSAKDENDKSLDTLMLEHEEKEIQAKLMAFGQSFITESENMLGSEHFQSSINHEEKENDTSIIIKENIRSHSNLKSLQKQFSCNQVIQVTTRDDESNRKMEIKTTAATTNRNNNFEENAMKDKNKNKLNNINHIQQNMTENYHKPFDYKRSESFENIKADNTEFQKEFNTYKPINYLNQKEEIKQSITYRVSHGLNKSGNSNERINKNDIDNISKDIEMIVKQSFKGTYMAVTDLFVGLFDFFNHEDSSDDESGSLVRCLGCSKNTKRKHISHKDRRIRAISQARLSKEKYFNMDDILSRSKSKEFLNNNALNQIMRVRSLTRIQTDVDRNSNTATLNSGNMQNSDSKRTINRPESSQEVKTNPSSKPHSKMISSDILDSNK